MQTVSLAILVFGLSRYIKLSRYLNTMTESLRRFKMDSETDPLIDELLGATNNEISSVEVAAVGLKQALVCFHHHGAQTSLIPCVQSINSRFFVTF